MNTKLTFTLENNSVPENEEELTRTVKSLKGSFKLPDDFDYKKELTKCLSEKYL